MLRLRGRQVLCIGACGLALASLACGTGSDRPTEQVAASAADDVATAATEVVPDLTTTTIGSVVTEPQSAAPSSYTVIGPEQLDLVDTSRPTIGNGETIATTRSLPSLVWRPAEPGRYPLVVFGHGFLLGPINYARFCAELARSGYVVVAPSFPLADASRGNGLDREDIPNQATDVGFVITSMLSGPLRSSIDAGRVGVVGHSDGADVALIAGYQAGRADPRIGAVVAISPDAMQNPSVVSSAPLLLIHADADSVVPYSESQQVFAQVGTTRYFLTLVGADHLPPMLGGNQWTVVVDSAVVLFLRATLGGDGSGAASLRNALDGLADSSLLSAG